MSSLAARTTFALARTLARTTLRVAWVVSTWNLGVTAAVVIAALAVGVFAEMTGVGFGTAAVLLAIVATAAVVLYWQEVRAWWKVWLFRRVIGHIGMAGHLLYAGRARIVPSGVAFDVRLGRGREFADLRRVRGEIASGVDCRRIALKAYPQHAGWGVVTVIERDPFKDLMVPWPWLNETHVDLSNGFPFGTTDDSSEVWLDIFKAPHTLFGGSSGFGKSASLQEVVAACALSDVYLYLVDGKDMELYPWRDSCDAFTSDPEEAQEIFRKLTNEIKNRQLELSMAGLRDVTHHRRHVLVIDELSEFGDLSDDLKPILKRGRAVGVHVVSATQIATRDAGVTPTIARLHNTRFALRCADRFMAESILGGGSAGIDRDEAQDAARSITTPGVGVLVGPQPEHVMLRTHYLTDEQIAAIAARTRRRP